MTGITGLLRRVRSYFDRVKFEANTRDAAPLLHLTPKERIMRGAATAEHIRRVREAVQNAKR